MPRPRDQSCRGRLDICTVDRSACQSRRGALYRDRNRPEEWFKFEDLAPETQAYVVALERAERAKRWSAGWRRHCIREHGSDAFDDCTCAGGPPLPDIIGHL